MRTAEATLHDWAPEHPRPAAWHWIEPANAELVRALATKTVLQLARLTDRPPDAPRARLLDVGCGDGRFASEALPYAAPFGVDAAPGTLAALAQLVRRGRFLAGGRGALPFASETFDVVTFLDVNERVRERAAPIAIREARRVLKPGGRLVVSAAHRGWKRSHRYSIRGFSRVFDDFSDIEIVGLIPGLPTMGAWMAMPIVGRLFRSRVRTCDPDEAQILIGVGVKR